MSSEQQEASAPAEGAAAAAGSAEPEHVSFWTARWNGTYKEQRPGFHEGSANAHLVEFQDRLVGASRSHEILVPLCGKSADLLHLAQFGNVAGVEVSTEAIAQFAKENELSWSLSDGAEGVFATPGPEGRTVVVGKFDFFNLPKAWSNLGDASKPATGKFTACWDRAALVAIDPTLRPQYVAALLEQLTADAKVLLNTFERAPGDATGPPFSVTEADVTALFGAAFEIELLKKCPILEGPLSGEGRFNLTLLLTRRQPADAPSTD